ncbi:MAG: YceI family protein [Chloroflexi bacterium]|uniref:YceI family protein n=1 Tax=Candidatus Chlorohelix allophototropha TaxID=3003348 RepID=A0A8T7M3T0_9CHLR|nr:YceI family protein [Chloroflexota bacterium]WJW66110.1 YceI family protein [Chloroflexota bacterium L227-S17]
MGWKIEGENTLIEFRVKKFWGLVKVRGKMTMRLANFNLEGVNPGNWSVYAEIDPASVNTGNARRDKHLKTADFFEVERYPLITFRSASIEQSDETHLSVKGGLTIRNITRTVTLDVTLIEESNIEAPQFRAATTLLRRDFGLNFNRMPIGREVEISVQVKALNYSAALHLAKSYESRVGLN